MKRIFLIIKLIFQIKIFFKEPKTSKLVIFDYESIVDMENVIKKFSHFEMKNIVLSFENHPNSASMC